MSTFLFKTREDTASFEKLGHRPLTLPARDLQESIVFQDFISGCKYPMNLTQVGLVVVGEVPTSVDDMEEIGSSKTDYAFTRL